MKTVVLAVLVVIFSLLLLHAQAKYESPSTSGNAFLRICSVVEKEPETQEDARNTLVCIAYVEGVGGGATVGAAYMEGDAPFKKTSYPFCVPGNVEAGQLIRIVLKYVRNHPEEAHKKSVYLVVDALHEAFPCKE